MFLNYAAKLIIYNDISKKIWYFFLLFFLIFQGFWRCETLGYYIAFSFGRGAVEEVARLKLKENIIIELVTVDKIVPIAKKPTIKVEIRELSRDDEKGIREIEFVAAGQSEAGIEFYSWDFDYDNKKGFKASVMIDKEGRQSHLFKAGVHTIAVKAVDVEGFESLETVQLKVNGVIKKL